MLPLLCLHAVAVAASIESGLEMWSLDVIYQSSCEPQHSCVDIGARAELTLHAHADATHPGTVRRDGRWDG